MEIPKLRSFRVASRSDLAEGVYSLTLVPADSEPLFSFEPGQWIMLHVLNPDGTTWRKAAFSIVSAPAESTASFELGIKIRGELTTRASKFEVGEKVKVQGPYGFFFLEDTVATLVLLAGGIGVTPFRSMIREMCLQKNTRNIYLFYSTGTREKMAYEKELRDLSRECPNFKPIFILTHETPADWDGESTRMSKEMLKSRGVDFKTADFMACGSTRFVQDIKVMLESEGVDLKNKFKQESF
ncbi:MAG: FAD-dependent oxidoreductase [Patescibacteria group bacterium]